MIEAGQPDVYEAAIHVDFLDVIRRNRTVRSLFSIRAAAEWAAATVRRTAAVSPPPPTALLLCEVPEHGDWVRLGEDPPNEFVFGVIGRFWAGATSFEQIGSSAFGPFDNPGYAKLAADLGVAARPRLGCRGAPAGSTRSA
ncbi:MAG: hypothetical protein M3022_05050 [Actinomycetota bacterium]|nr:hypothetical protein [Actinomycetota bacterium]